MQDAAGYVMLMQAAADSCKLLHTPASCCSKLRHAHYKREQKVRHFSWT
jgi:hypothetical protein